MQRGGLHYIIADDKLLRPRTKKAVDWLYQAADEQKKGHWERFIKLLVDNQVPLGARPVAPYLRRMPVELLATLRKKCLRCGDDKEFDQFTYNAGCGYYSYCLECVAVGRKKDRDLLKYKPSPALAAELKAALEQETMMQVAERYGTNWQRLYWWRRGGLI